MNQIIGTLNNDNLIGTGLDEILIGLAGRDTLDGGEGNDTLRGNRGKDLLNGGLGNDSIEGGSGNDTIIGSAGSDTLNGGPGEDVRDYSQLGRAITVDAFFTNKGNGEFDRATGFETIIGAVGFDNAIDISNSPSPTASLDVDLSSDRLTGIGIPGGGFTITVQNFVNVTGTVSNDIIKGDNADNILIGGAGNDTIIGSGGSDTLNGGAGLDVLDYSQLGRAVTIEPLRIDKGNGEFDTPTDGFETIIGAVGFDNAIDASSSPSPTVSVDIDLSSDRLSVLGLSVGDVTTNVQNFVNVTGTIGNDVIKGDSGNNIIDGGAGNDTIIGSGGSDTLNGGDGLDVLDYSQLGRAINLETFGTEKGNGEIDSRPLGFETVIGAVGFDNLIDASRSTSQTAFLDIDLAADRATLVDSVTGGFTLTVQNFVNVDGTPIGDVIKGDSGNNIINGGAGNDTIIGSLGSDTLNGGDGFDTRDYSQLGRAITLTPLGTDKGNGEVDSVRGFEKVIGAVGFDNVIDVSVQANQTVSADIDLAANRLTALNTSTGDFVLSVENFVNVIGTTLADTIAGDNGNNILDGDRGGDIIFGRGGADTIFGRSGADTLKGGSGTDVLKGGRGDDVLTGGSGFDTLTGGSGADTFVITPNSGFDVIADFETGVDKLDFTAFGFTTDIELLGAGVFGGVNDSVPGFTFTLPNFGVTLFIENRDVPLPSTDIIF